MKLFGWNIWNMGLKKKFKSGGCLQVLIVRVLPKATDRLGVSCPWVCVPGVIMS